MQSGHLFPVEQAMTGGLCRMRTGGIITRQPAHRLFCTGKSFETGSGIAGYLFLAFSPGGKQSSLAAVSYGIYFFGIETPRFRIVIVLIVSWNEPI